MQLHHIKALAFDLDGTLVDSIPDLADAANAMRTQMGLPPLPAARIREHVGDGIASLVHRALTDSTDGQADEARWTEGFQAFIAHYRANLTRQTRAYPGVETALELFKTLQLPLAVITNKPEQLAVPLLKELGLADLFALILGGDSLPERKPSAQPLLHACQVFGIQPADLAMIGDSKNDVLAARAAGSAAILVSYGYADPSALGADLVLDTLPDLFDHLRPRPVKD